MPLHGRRFYGVDAVAGVTPPLGDGGNGDTGSGGTILAAGATGQGSIKLSKELILHEIEADKACRVVFYATNADATRDKNRKLGTPPNPTSGVQCEFLFSAPNQTIECDPEPSIQNGDLPQTDLIYYRVTNLSGGNASVTLTLNYTALR